MLVVIGGALAWQQGWMQKIFSPKANPTPTINSSPASTPMPSTTSIITPIPNACEEGGRGYCAKECKSGDTAIWLAGCSEGKICCYKGELPNDGSEEYIACGCGCCGGVEPVVKCLYHSKGDDIQKIIEEDKKQAQDPICPTAGCSQPIKYIYCD